MRELDGLRQTAEQAALAAASEVMRYREQGVRPHDKAFRSSVTEGDVAAQASAVAVIRSAFPDHEIVGEEEGDLAPHNADGNPDSVRWYIDPIDGTTNYVLAVPFFCVSVGVSVASEPVVGVIYDPLRERGFVAVRGQGAALDEVPLHVGDRSRLADCVIGFDMPSQPDVRRAQWNLIGGLSERCRTVRALGSAALGLAYVAAGRLDAYVHLNLSPWDVAAGAVLVTEAGGVTVRPDGGHWHVDQPAIVATNADLVDELVAAIGGSPEG